MHEHFRALNFQFLHEFITCKALKQHTEISVKCISKVVLHTEIS